MYLHREEICGHEGTPNYDIKQLAVKCSSTRLYPDWLSIDEGYQAEIYEKTGGHAVSPMGCRAFLGDFKHPETGEYVIEGRANIGAVTINVPKFAIESKGDIDKFYELTDKYIDMVFMIHLDSYERIGKSKASTNPLFYCEGGCWTKLDYDEPIAKALEGFTASLGYIGYEEASWALFNSPLQDNVEFFTEYSQHLWDKCMEYKEKYGKLFTLYSTPAEGLIEKFQKINRKQYGVIKNVTDKAYMTNSFH